MELDRADLKRLFAKEAWDWLACEESTIHRYREPKVAWEIVLASCNGAPKAGQSGA